MAYATEPILEFIAAHDGSAFDDIARHFRIVPSPSLELALLQLCDERPYGVRAECVGGLWYARQRVPQEGG